MRGGIRATLAPVLYNSHNHHDYLCFCHWDIIKSHSLSLGDELRGVGRGRLVLEGQRKDLYLNPKPVGAIDEFGAADRDLLGF